MALVERVRLWRLRRLYSRLLKLDLKLHDNKDAAELRAEFASDTVKRARMGFVAAGVPRHERKRFLRQIAKGK